MEKILLLPLTIILFVGSVYLGFKFFQGFGLTGGGRYSRLIPPEKTKLKHRIWLALGLLGGIILFIAFFSLSYQQVFR